MRADTHSVGILVHSPYTGSGVSLTYGERLCASFGTGVSSPEARRLTMNAEIGERQKDVKYYFPRVLISRMVEHCRGGGAVQG
jgi:hypothetical protein